MAVSAPLGMMAHVRSTFGKFELLLDESRRVAAIVLDMAPACGDYELTFAQIRMTAPAPRSM